MGPRRLHGESEHFAPSAREMVRFNVCLLMFASQNLFDSDAAGGRKPAVTRTRFILDESERERRQTHVLPKLQQCTGSEKVMEPRWTRLHA